MLESGKRYHGISKVIFTVGAVPFCAKDDTHRSSWVDAVSSDSIDITGVIKYGVPTGCMGIQSFPTIQYRLVGPTATSLVFAGFLGRPSHYFYICT